MEWMKQMNVAVDGVATVDGEVGRGSTGEVGENGVAAVVEKVVEDEWLE